MYVHTPLLISKSPKQVEEHVLYALTTWQEASSRDFSLDKSSVILNNKFLACNLCWVHWGNWI